MGTLCNRERAVSLSASLVTNLGEAICLKFKLRIIRTVGQLIFLKGTKSKRHIKIIAYCMCRNRKKIHVLRVTSPLLGAYPRSLRCAKVKIKKNYSLSAHFIHYTLKGVVNNDRQYQTVWSMPMLKCPEQNLNDFEI